MTIGTIPKKHTAKSVVGTLRWLREDPENRRVVVRDYFGDTFTADGFERWFLARLTAKINRNETPRGRKDCWEWERDARDIARRMNGRIFTLVRQCPPEYRSRLAHRLHETWEE